MIISPQAAQKLCSDILMEFDALGPVLPAILQSAGCERKFEGPTQRAISKWLAHDQVGETKDKLICIPEYRFADFTLVERASVGRARLVVDTIIEAKFNFAVQTGEIVNRIGAAIERVNEYANLATDHQIGRRPDPYLLYVVANYQQQYAIPAGGCDEGWRYMRTPTRNRTLTTAAETLRQMEVVIGEDDRQFGQWEIHVALIRA